MDELLGRVELWLSTHAPGTLSGLRPPLPPGRVEDLAAMVGGDLHPDVRALMSWHDGSIGMTNPFDIIPGFTFMSAEDSQTALETKREIDSAYPAERLRGGPLWWATWGLPIATDYCGDHLVVDHTPGASYGRVFIADKIDGAMPFDTWDSVAALFTDLVATLEDNTAFLLHPSLEYRTVSEDQRLLWHQSAAGA